MLGEKRELLIASGDIVISSYGQPHITIIREAHGWALLRRSVVILPCYWLILAVASRL